MPKPSITTFDLHYSTLEESVFNVVVQCLQSNEIIEITSNIRNGHQPTFDFYLPKGCKILSWPDNTYIEVKYRVIQQTFAKLKKGYDICNPKELVVIYFEEIALKEIIANNASELNNRHIKFIQFNQLIEIVNKLHINNKTDGQLLSSDRFTTCFLSFSSKLSDLITHQSKLSLFIGAGVSSDAGVPTWKCLLEKLCIKKNIDKIDSAIDDVIKGRYIIDQYKDTKSYLPEIFYKDVRDILYEHTHESKLMHSIANLVQTVNVESIVTYNYDSILEDVINNKGPKQCESIYDKSRTENLPVFHVHGFIPQNGEHSEIILGEKEYHKIYKDSFHWSNIEQLHALSRNTCLFIGLSMNDPNLRRLIDISIESSEIESVHYAFLRKIEHHRDFTERIMRGFGINCIWYDDYSDLPKLIDGLYAAN